MWYKYKEMLQPSGPLSIRISLFLSNQFRHDFVKKEAYIFIYKGYCLFMSIYNILPIRTLK